MIYLLLNIIFGSLFLLCIKWVQNRKQEDIVTIGMINYIAGALAITPEFIQSHPSVVTPQAMVAGGTMGACYFVAFFFCCLCHQVDWCCQFDRDWSSFYTLSDPGGNFCLA